MSINKITTLERKQIYDMAQEGVSDKAIAKELNRHVTTIQIITTQFWKEKMRNKG